MGVITYDRKECLDPISVRGQCLAHNVPVEWFGLPTQYVNPLGLRCGVAWVILKRKDLAEINAGFHELKIGDLPLSDALLTSTEIKLPSLRIVGHPHCLLPGWPDDPDSPYLLELADRRVDIEALSFRRYNWRPSPTADYDTDSLNSGVAWTWEELLTDLWDQVGILGTWPGLTDELTGTPEMIDAHACRAADVLEDLLLIHGFAIRYNPVDDDFTIVDLTVESPNTDAALKRFEKQVAEDRYPYSPSQPLCPQYCRVVFPVWAPDSAAVAFDAYFVVDKADETGLNAAAQQANTYSIIQDFQPARSDVAGTIDNSADLVTRADILSAIFFARATAKAYQPLARSFYGLCYDKNLLPGGGLDIVAYRDTGELQNIDGSEGGWITTVARVGRQGFPTIWKPASFTPDTDGGLLNEHFTNTALKVNNQAGAKVANVRAGGFPPSQLRYYAALSNQPGTSPVSGSAYGPYDLLSMLRGAGEGPLSLGGSPLRTWDQQIIGPGGKGNPNCRLWRQWDRRKSVDPSEEGQQGNCILASLRQGDCLKATSGAQVIYLEYDTGTWTSVETITYPGAGSPGVVVFWYADGRVRLSVDGIELIDCGNGCFTGGPLTGHTAQDSGTECAGDTFTVCVECSCCPIEGWDGPGYYCVEDTGPLDCIVQLLTEEDKCDEGIVICSGPYATLAEAQAVCGGVDADVACESLWTNHRLLDVSITVDNPDCSCLEQTFQIDGDAGGASPPAWSWSATEIAPSTCTNDSGTNWTMTNSMVCSDDAFGVGTLTYELHIESFGTSDCPISLDSDIQAPTVLVESPFMAIFNLTISGVNFTVTVTEP